MTNKIGRNDPCPCGSGKKYKKCCANAHAELGEAERKSHDGAVDRAIEWLMTMYRKAVSAAIEEILFGGLSEDEQEALAALDGQIRQNIYINATEWLLAEGHIQVKGEYKRVSELILGRGGPLFTVDQRRWIEQLSERHLCLYKITDVIPGEQMTVCDALDTEALPIIVKEKSGSQASMLGTYIGARLMEVDDHFELSGAVYPFSKFASPDVISQMQKAMTKFDKGPEVLPGLLSTIIRHKWLEQFYAPTRVPSIMDSYSGEPVMLITDHYRVKDWKALEKSMATQSDVEGDCESGWNRFIDCEDGQIRASATINIEEGVDKITLFYKTQSYADQGRPWFEAVAGNAVQFVTREISDPAGVMAKMPDNPKQRSKATGPDLPPEAYAEIIEETYHRIYADWVNEQIPALNNQTPRQAIKTPAGLERVKGLLREYEANEKQQAAEQGRREVSFEFLWRELGISP